SFKKLEGLCATRGKLARGLFAIPPRTSSPHHSALARSDSPLTPLTRRHRPITVHLQSATPHRAALCGLSPEDRMSQTPVSLLERLRRPGEEAAWMRFVELYTPLLYYWGRRAGLQEPDAADLVQDVLTLLVRKLPEFTYDRHK